MLYDTSTGTLFANFMACVYFLAICDCVFLPFLYKFLT